MNRNSQRSLAEEGTVKKRAGRSSSSQRTHGVESARRVLQILFQFTAEDPIVSIDSLAERLGCSVGSAYRYIALLREFFLVEEHSRGHYRLTPRVYALADSVDHLHDLKFVARPTLEQLAKDSEETAILVRAIDDTIICVDAVVTDRALRITFTPGQLLPMHRGASAKVMLAGLPKRRRQKYLERELESGSLTSQELGNLEAELVGIAESGYAESEAEVDAGVWAAAAGIRVQGKVVAAVSVVGPDSRLTRSKRSQIKDLVVSAAAEVSSTMSDGMSDL